MVLWTTHSWCSAAELHELTALNDRARQGRTGPPDPLARVWPERFAGTWDDYVRFAVEIDPWPQLRARAQVWISRWPMAVLNRFAVRYNVAVKHDWP